MNNTKPFQYCLLKYCPSYALGEQVNVGIFFFFEEELEVKFVFPAALSRLSSLFPSADINVLRKYFKHIQSKIIALSKDKELLRKSTLDGLQKIILIPDSSSLFFEKTRVSKYVTIQKATEYYSNSYLGVYKNEIKRERKDEAYLKNTFKNKLKKAIAGNELKLNLFEDAPVVENKISNTQFDIGWKNGTTNLIKFLSFDFTDKASFQEKSFRWYGELSQLGEQNRYADLKFDLVLTKPQDSSLFTSYDKVLEFLKDIQINKSIIQEEQLDEYICKAVETVQPFTRLDLLR